MRLPPPAKHSVKAQPAPGQFDQQRARSLVAGLADAFSIWLPPLS
jgi:hypothetical protein